MTDATCRMMTCRNSLRDGVPEPYERFDSALPIDDTEPTTRIRRALDRLQPQVVALIQRCLVTVGARLGLFRWSDYGGC